MKRILKGIFILLLPFLLALPTWAGDSAQQTVSFQVEEIYSAYFPDEVSFILDTFTWQWYQGIFPILDPDEVTHYYNLTVTRPAYLKARILNNMEEFRLLTVNASVPSGKGISYGEKELNYYDSGYPKPAQTLAYIDEPTRFTNVPITYKAIASLFVQPGTYYNTIEFTIMGE